MRPYIHIAPYEGNKWFCSIHGYDRLGMGTEKSYADAIRWAFKFIGAKGGWVHIDAGPRSEIHDHVVQVARKHAQEAP